MDSVPAISVIMPVYKTDEVFLKEAIESVLNQTFDDFEFIIINSSQEESEELILSYDDKRIKYVVQAKSGQSKARNIGLNMAKGKYIYFLDADDWITPETFEKSYNKSEEYNYDVLISNAVYYNNQTKESTDWAIDLKQILLENTVYTINHGEILHYLFIISWTPWGKLYKRDFLIKNNLFFIENMIFEDVELYFRYMPKAKKIGIIFDKLYYYRNFIDNASTANFDERHFDVIKATHFMEQDLKEHEIFEKTKIGFYDFKYALIRHRFNNFDKELKEKFASLALEDLNSNFKLSSREFQKLRTHEKMLEWFDEIGYKPIFTSRLDTL